MRSIFTARVIAVVAPFLLILQPAATVATGARAFGAHGRTAETALKNVSGDAKALHAPRSAAPALPLHFEENPGQLHSSAEFVGRSAGFEFLIWADKLMVRRTADNRAAVTEREGEPRITSGCRRLGSECRPRRPVPAEVQLEFARSNRGARVVADDPNPATTNYLIGKNPSAWQTGIKSYSRVKVEGIYPGIDLVYYGSGASLEYDLEIAPGADTRLIRMRFPGAVGMRTDSSGDLVIKMLGGEVRQRRPQVYQVVEGVRQPLEARYLVGHGREVALLIEGKGAGRWPMVIDPVLELSTYFGGASVDTANGVAVDSQGAVYVVGSTSSADLLTKPGVVNPGGFAVGTFYAFVAKFETANTRLLYCTIFGGNFLPGTSTAPAHNSGNGIAVDSSGNAYVIGTTDARDFPTTPGAFQPALARGLDAFVVKLNPQGSALSFATYLGGSESTLSFYQNQDFGLGIAVDSMGSAYVTGVTNSSDFPTTSGVVKPVNSERCVTGEFGPILFCTDAFVTKLNPAGTALVYSTYLGGGGDDAGAGIAVDSAGNAYVVGSTSGGIPATAGAAQSAYGGSGDGFVAKLNGDGSSLVYATFLGGPGTETAAAVAVDDAGRAYVTGSSTSTTLPVSATAPQAISHSQVFFKSTDGGGSWQPASTGLLSNAEVYRVAVDPADPAKIYAAAGGLCTSSDGALTWNSLPPIPFPGGQIMAFHPLSPSIAYVAVPGSFNSVYRNILMSSSRGQQGPYVVQLDTSDSIENVTIDPSNPSILYITSLRKLVKAREMPDQPFDVRTIGEGLPNNFGTVMAISPRDSSVLFATPSQVARPLYKSTNAGKFWQPVPVPGSTVTAVAFDPLQPRTVYAAGSGLFRSVDEGESWQEITNDLPSIFFGSLLVDPTTPVIMYTATIDGVFKTTDGGKTWHHADAGLTGIPPGAAFNPVYKLTMDPRNPKTLYAARPGAGSDVFVAKVSPSGSAFEYLTYLGGGDADSASAIAIDSAGNAYVTGQTASLDFPTQKAVQPDNRNSPDAFIARLDAGGGRLEFSSYAGGTDADNGSGIAVDRSGNVFVVGRTASTNFGTRNAFQSSFSGLGDAFVLRFSAADSNQPAPVINDVQPASAPSTGAAVLAVSGENFIEGATVSVGGIPATVLGISGTAITVVAPANTPGPARVVVANPDGQSAVLAERFEYLARPVIYDAFVSGQSLSVFAVALDKGAAILVNGKPQPSEPTGANSLFSKKGGKKIKAGQNAIIRVQNGNGLLSAPFSFKRTLIVGLE